MAKATYAPMFETVSGALNLIHKKSPHAADQKMVLTTLSQDQANFLAQKDTAGGKTTFKAYLWKVCGDAYDAQH